jgi:hypothetical protein
MMEQLGGDEGPIGCMGERARGMSNQICRMKTDMGRDLESDPPGRSRSIVIFSISGSRSARSQPLRTSVDDQERFRTIRNDDGGYEPSRTVRLTATEMQKEQLIKLRNCVIGEILPYTKSLVSENQN